MPVARVQPTEYDHTMSRTRPSLTRYPGFPRRSVSLMGFDPDRPIRLRGMMMGLETFDIAGRSRPAIGFPTPTLQEAEAYDGLGELSRTLYNFTADEFWQRCSGVLYSRSIWLPGSLMAPQISD